MSIVSSPIDLSLLPRPDALEVVDFEAIYAERKRRLVDLFAPGVQDAVAETLRLESEPMAVVLEENSYREMVIRQRVNECVRRVLLAFARGTDLDHIGARYYVPRLKVQEADPTTVPPTPVIFEDDDPYLERIQDAYEGLSIAGPRGAYIFHTRSADGRVCDATAVSPEPCEVLISVLSVEGDGTASEALLDVVRAALNEEDIRPLADLVTVQSSVIVPYSIKAKLYMTTSGAGRDQALALAVKNVEEHSHRRKRQGWSVWLSKLDSLMHVEGVDRVEIIEPGSNIVLDHTQAALCTSIDITDADAPVGL